MFELYHLKVGTALEEETQSSVSRANHNLTIAVKTLNGPIRCYHFGGAGIQTTFYLRRLMASHSAGTTWHRRKGWMAREVRLERMTNNQPNDVILSNLLSTIKSAYSYTLFL